MSLPLAIFYFVSIPLGMDAGFLEEHYADTKEEHKYCKYIWLKNAWFGAHKESRKKESKKKAHTNQRKRIILKNNYSNYEKHIT